MDCTADTAHTRICRQTMFPLILVALGILAYANSFSVPFTFDDGHAIVESEALSGGYLRPILARRGIVYLTLLANYKISGLSVANYHATNLLIHIAAGLLLYGIVRRSFGTPALRKRYAASAAGLALAVAAVWVVHPLQTQSVTYIIQRFESLTGFFYLLTLYCVIRGGASRLGWPWYVAAIVSSVLGAGCKETIVTLPVIILAYDRIFLASSFRDLFRRRWVLYTGLLGTWIVLGVFVAIAGNGTSMAAGFAYMFLGARLMAFLPARLPGLAFRSAPRRGR